MTLPNFLTGDAVSAVVRTQAVKGGEGGVYKKWHDIEYNMTPMPILCELNRSEQKIKNISSIKIQGEIQKLIKHSNKR